MPKKSKYNQEYHDDWAWSLAVRGATNEDMADAFGITSRTLTKWERKYDSFGKAIKDGREASDPRVEKSLFRRATGYEATDTETITEIDENGNPKPTKVRQLKKHIPPDTMACMYWLNNRSRGRWSQRQEVDLNATDTGNNVLIYLPANGRDKDEEAGPENNDS